MQSLTDPTRRRKPRRWARALAVVFGLVLGLAIAEIGLRLYLSRYDCLRFAQPDAEIGWVLKENFSDTCIEAGYLTPVDIRVNALNMRGPELEIPKPPDRFRILFLGDSMTFGAGISAEESFPGILDQWADSSGLAEIEVINAGVPGYGTIQELLFYQRISGMVQPDIVVLVFFAGNDLRDNTCSVHNPTRPCARLEPENNELIVVFPDKAVIESYGAAEDQTPVQELRIAAYLESWLVNISGTHPGLAGALGRLGISQPASPFIESWFAPDSFESGWPLTAAILDRLHDAVTADGIPIVIVVLPDISQVSADHAGFLLETYMGTPAGLGFRQNPDLPQQTIRAWGARADVLVIDPRDAIEAAPDVNRLFLPDRHLSPAGHALLAELLASAFLENHLLPER